MIITNNDLFIQTTRSEDSDIVNWYFDLKTHVPEDSTFHRVMAKVRDKNGDDLMQHAQSLWDSFIDCRDIWADRFHKVAQSHEAYADRFGFTPPEWMFDLTKRKDGRVQYRIPRTRDLREGDDHLIMSNAECDRIDMIKRLTQQQHARVALVREIAADRGIDLAALGIHLPKLDELDVQDAVEDRKKLARERKAKYRAAKTKDKLEAAQEVAQTPEQRLRMQVAELLAENKSLKRENTGLKSENHRLPIFRETAREHAVDMSPFLASLTHAQAQVEALQAELKEAQSENASVSRAMRSQNQKIADLESQIETFKQRESMMMRSAIVNPIRRAA